MSDNIYLDNLKEVSEFENQILDKHIDDARNLLKSYNSKINDNNENFLDKDKNIRVMFSDILITLRNQINNINILNDIITINNSDIKKLSEGIKPYKYTDCKTSTDIFDKMFSINTKNVNEINDISNNITYIEKNINILRRNYEDIISKV